MTPQVCGLFGSRQAVPFLISPSGQPHSPWAFRQIRSPSQAIPWPFASHEVAPHASSLVLLIHFTPLSISHASSSSPSHLIYSHCPLMHVCFSSHGAISSRFSQVFQPQCETSDCVFRHLKSVSNSSASLYVFVSESKLHRR